MDDVGEVQGLEATPKKVPNKDWYPGAMDEPPYIWASGDVVNMDEEETLTYKR